MNWIKALFCCSLIVGGLYPHGSNALVPMAQNMFHAPQAGKGTTSTKSDQSRAWDKKRKAINEALQRIKEAQNRAYTDCDQRVKFLETHTKYKKNKIRKQEKVLLKELKTFAEKEKLNIKKTIALFAQTPEENQPKYEEKITQTLNDFSMNCRKFANGIADRMVESDPRLPSPMPVSRIPPRSANAPKDMTRVVREVTRPS